MNTSADRLTIVQRSLADPQVVQLIATVQEEYVVRYGGPDETPMDPAQFEPPTGMFLLGLERVGMEQVGLERVGLEPAGTPVACGGWRAHGAGSVELKRMFVVASARRRGYAALLLAALENSARAAGNIRVVLETGSAQPEAIAMYTSAGYRPTEAFGFYKCTPSAIHLAKEL